MTKKNVGIWLSMFALIVSIINVFVVCIYNPRAEVEFDYQGIIVGSLSILVTVLIGWNIYSVIDFKKHVESLEFKTQAYKKDTEANFEKQSHEIEQRHYFIEGKTAVSLMEVFLRLKDSLPDTINNTDVPPLDYHIVCFGLIGIANQQKSDTYNFSDNLLEKLIQYIEEKPFTLKEEYFKEIMKLYHQLSSNDSKRYRDLYRLLITLEEVK